MLAITTTLKVAKIITTNSKHNKLMPMPLPLPLLKFTKPKKEAKKEPRATLVSQTDILTDSIHLEKAKSDEIKKKNEKVDRRLARLGIKLESEQEKPKDEESDNGMEISSESENEAKVAKKKRRKKDKSKVGTSRKVFKNF